MTPERWRQIDDLLDAALERPAEEWPDFLEGACSGEPELRRQVESMLELELSQGLLEQPAFSVHAEDPRLGHRIGPYRIERLLGRGGMGAVYLAAREDDYASRVALKLIKPGMDSDEIVRRFRGERQILAGLDHPNIARILDGGTTEDRLPYFAMEYVEGEPIDAWCDRQRLTTRQRLQLFRQVCAAVHVSHRHLVVHRDLKPGNILVTAGGVPKLLDFGIAKLLHPSLSSGTAATATQTVDHRPMTYEYASPEQARGEPIDTTSDVYSLGVLLYRLLSGHAPYPSAGHTPMEILQQVCNVDPPRPSTAIRHRQEVRHSDGTVEQLTPESVSRVRDGDPRKLRRRLAGDLDAIVAKAMRKEPGLRYGSVEQLSEDIRRHLRGLPVRAHQGSFTYFAGKFARRHQLGLGVLVLSLAFAVTAGVLGQQALRGQEEARKAEKLALDSGKAARDAQRVAQQAENRFRQALEFFQDIFQDANPDRRAALATGSPSLDGDQILEVLELLFEQARTRLAEEDSEVQAELMSTLARIYRNLGSYQKARELFEESLTVRRSHYPHTHLELAIGMNDLGSVLYDLGEYQQAEEIVAEALEIVRLALRAEDESPRRIASNLATFYRNRGNYAKAEEIFLEILEIRRQLYGDEHEEVAKTLGQLGAVYFTQGDLERAEPTLREALAMRRILYSAGDTKIATALNNLAAVLKALERYREAEEMYREALAIRRDRLGDDHPSVATTKKNLGEVLLAQGDVDGAEALVEEALATFLDSKPEDDWRVADARSVLGACRVARGRYGEAEPLLLDSYGILHDDRGESAIYTRDARARIAALYEAWGRLEEAAEYRHPGPPGPG